MPQGVAVVFSVDGDHGGYPGLPPFGELQLQRPRNGCSEVPDNVERVLFGRASSGSALIVLPEMVETGEGDP